MKSLAELREIREKNKANVAMRLENPDHIRVVVGTGSGDTDTAVRSVTTAFLNEMNNCGLYNVMLTQSGHVGTTGQEPVVEVYMPGQEKVTYAKVTPERAAQIVSEHLVNGKAIDAFIVGAAE